MQSWTRRPAAPATRSRFGGLARYLSPGAAGATARRSLDAIRPLLRITRLETALSVAIGETRRGATKRGASASLQGLPEKDRLMGRIERLERENARLVSILRTPATAKVSMRAASAHDLKTPLCTLESILDTLVNVLDEDGDQRQAKSLARLAELSSARMRALVDDIVEQARDGGPTETPDTRIDVGKLFAEAIDLHRPAIEESGISVHVAGSLPVVRGQRRAFVAVVNNLIDNAVKYMGSGRIREIHVGSDVEAGQPTIWIEDTGCGFDAARIDEAFKPYGRCNKEVSGSGLGLAIVKKAVESWGGSVKLDTLPGRGTTVRFTTPAAVSKTDVPIARRTMPLSEERA